MAAPQRRHQPGQRDLRGIGHAPKHRFAAEYPVEPDAIEPADELPATVRTGLPAFDRVREAKRVELFVAALDAMADPALPVLGRARGRAGVHHVRERCVAGHREAPAPQRAGQRARQVKTVEREDCPLPGLDPENFGIVAPVRHRENAAAIGQHQQFRLDRGRDQIGGHDKGLSKNR
ncbi:hypothetical protein GCM10011614_06680 [Novosphingobium colocasiae]|uniref:Uncharacterized protein n=1 Tax=Novosphingobium colocasiae TaxID=1256513 RepID=A0A918PAM4_9SPHN|nr:hypothetical protein GCM10011614_06680 [Novosphingobium colocasiae]